MSNGWQPIETAPIDGGSVLLFTTCHGICEAWFSPGEWSDENPICPRDYSGDCWVCCDDAFQIDVEYVDQAMMHHGTATHWMPLSSPPA